MTLFRPRHLLGPALLGPALLAILDAQTATAPRPAAATTGQFPLTVDSIMRGPTLVGYAPSGLRWSGDGRHVSFEWQQRDEKETATWVVDADGSGLRRLSDGDRRLAPPVTGQWDKARSRVPGAIRGDIALIDTVAGTHTDLTRMTGGESAPRWARNETHITFVRDEKIDSQATLAERRCTPGSTRRRWSARNAIPRARPSRPPLPTPDPRTEMTTDSVLALFRQRGALLEGHFVLSSGLHSTGYLQCALILQHPTDAEALGRALGEKVKAAGYKVDVVLSPAMGGLIIGHEVGRALGVRAIFVERVDGTLTLRRGFRIDEGEKVLVVEDVVTTGKSTLETVAVAEHAGATVVAAASIINRGGGDQMAIPYVSLAEARFPTYAADALPEHLKGVPVIKPGSRPGQK